MHKKNRLTTEEFIKKAIAKHSTKYVYSLVDYISYKDKVKIICPTHGIFEQTPANHLKGLSCYSCQTQAIIEKFFINAKKKYNNKYDYSLAEYVDCETKLKIICPVHGIFEDTPSTHLRSRNRGCGKCNGHIITTEIFIERARAIQGDKFNYSLVEYVRSNDKVKIICPIHGVFEQTPSAHLQGCDCLKCAEILIGDKARKSTETFISQAKKKHGSKYNYRLVEYTHGKDKVSIICPIHGEFKQTAADHLQSGCLKCGGREMLTNETFIQKARERHGDLYDYSLVEYKNNRTKVTIICSKHGEFRQTPSHHMHSTACPKCKSSKGETTLMRILEKRNIGYISQHKFDECRNKNPLSFDFYLPDYNICIEYDGKQHFIPVKKWGGEEYFKYIKLCDSIKNSYCMDNGITLVRVPYSVKDIEGYLSHNLVCSLE